MRDQPKLTWLEVTEKFDCIGSYIKCRDGSKEMAKVICVAHPEFVDNKA